VTQSPRCHTPEPQTTMDFAAYYDRYWEEIGDTFDHERLEVIVKYVPHGTNLLEVDCGPGVLAARLRDERAATVQGTDFSPVAVQRASERGIPCQLVTLDHGEALPHPSNTFQTVVSNNAIEHRFRHEWALDECIRVLAPGGRFILCLPNIAHWLCRWWLLTGRFPIVRHSPTDATHLRMFAIPDARALLESRGLQVIAMDGSASLWAKTFYPAWVRKHRLRPLYTTLAHRWPALFARDFVIVAQKR
jgi:methionine biosynthesis protein MetW